MPFVKNGEREVTTRLKFQVKVLVIKETVFKNILLEQGKKEAFKCVENVFVQLFEKMLSEKLGNDVNAKTSGSKTNENN